MKRIWGKRFNKVRSEMLDPNPSFATRRDFAWRQRKQNPFHGVSEQTSLEKVKRPILLIVICLLIGGSVGLLLFHPFFQVKQLQVSGFQRIVSSEVEDTVNGILAKKHYYVFPGSNFFLLDTEEVQDILLARYPLEEVVVNTVFPNTLTILVEEKVPIAIYDNEKQYFFVDSDGKVIEPLRRVTDDEWYIHKETVTSTVMVTTTLPDGMLARVAKEITEEKEVSRTHIPPVNKLTQELGLYPVIYDQRKKEAGVNSIILEPQYTRAIISWITLLSSYTDVSVLYTYIENVLGDARLKTGEGWEILVRLDRAPEEQFDEFKSLLQGKVNRSALQYVDLRFPGKIYWR